MIPGAEQRRDGRHNLTAFLRGGIAVRQMELPRSLPQRLVYLSLSCNQGPVSVADLHIHYPEASHP